MFIFNFPATLPLLRGARRAGWQFLWSDFPVIFRIVDVPKVWKGRLFLYSVVAKNKHPAFQAPLLKRGEVGPHRFSHHSLLQYFSFNEFRGFREGAVLFPSFGGVAESRGGFSFGAPVPTSWKVAESRGGNFFVQFFLSFSGWLKSLRWWKGGFSCPRFQPQKNIPPFGHPS